MNLESFNLTRLSLQTKYLKDTTGQLYKDYYSGLSPSVQAQLLAESSVYRTLYEEILSKIDDDTKLAWVTFNPSPQTPLTTILKLCDNIVKKKWIDNASYSLEQRGKDSSTMGTGIHVHFLFKDIKKPVSHIHREIFNTVKNYVGNPRHVKVQTFPGRFYSDKYEYLLGNKWDEEKSSSIEVDKIWREKNNLLGVYTK